MEHTINIKVGTPFEKKMTWEEAKKYAEEQGMRLPTRLESFALIEHKDELGITLPDWWWTSEESSATNAWYVNDYGYVHGDTKYNAYYVVPVSTLEDSELEPSSLRNEQSELSAEEMVKRLRNLGYEVKCTNYTYRIKPEPHYRPFQNAKEVMEAIKEHGNYVKTTVDSDDYIFPVAFSTNGKRVSFCDILNDAWADNEYALKNYTFTDGTPFGKLED